MERTVSRRFVQALPADNPYLSPEYVDVLKETFAHRPELLEAYLHGSWDALEGADQIIKAEWVREAATKTLVGWARRPRLVCDPARFGDDESVIMYMEITDIEDYWIMAQCSSPVLRGKLAELSHAYKGCPVVIETTGGDFGAAVLDELGAQGVKTVSFVPQGPAGQANDPNKYGNRRSETWAKVAKKLVQGQVELRMPDPAVEPVKFKDYQELLRQLTCVRYSFCNGKLYVEDKDDIKKRLNRSPDRADCWIIGVWSYDAVPTPDMVAVAESQDLAESYATRSVLV